MQRWHSNLKKIMYAYLIATKEVHSSALFYLTLVLSTILIWSTAWIRWRLGICGLQACVCVHQPPLSKDCKKLGGGLGARLRIHLIWPYIFVDSWAWDTGESNVVCVIGVKKTERCYAGLIRLVSYFMRSVIYFMRWVSYPMHRSFTLWRSVTLWIWSANICWQPPEGVAGLAQE